MNQETILKEHDLNTRYKEISVDDISICMSDDIKNIYAEIKKITSPFYLRSILTTGLFSTPLFVVYMLLKFESLPIAFISIFIPLPVAIISVVLISALKDKSESKKINKINVELIALNEELSIFIKTVLQYNKNKRIKNKLTEKEYAQKIKDIYNFLDNIKSNQITIKNLYFFESEYERIKKDFDLVIQNKLTSKEKNELLDQTSEIEKIIENPIFLENNKNMEKEFNFIGK